MSAAGGPPASGEGAGERDAMFAGLQRRLRRRHWLGDLWLACGRKRAMLLGGARAAAGAAPAAAEAARCLLLCAPPPSLPRAPLTSVAPPRFSSPLSQATSPTSTR